MRNKPSMTQVLFILFMTIVFCSCENDGKSKSKQQESVSSGHPVIVIDSCEYIESYYSVCHKHNCSFCLERNKK